MRASSFVIAGSLALSAGCSFPAPSEQFRCAAVEDCDDGRVCEQGFCVTPGDGVDAGADPKFDCASWTPAPAHFAPCEIDAPKGPLLLETAGVYTFDTDTGMLANPAGERTTFGNTIVPTGLVLSVDRFFVGAGSTLNVVGAKPLIVAAWGDIDVRGTIDASSQTAAALARTGAGANPVACASRAAAPGRSLDDGAGGGGGGAFQGAGGRGGNGNGNNSGNGGAGGLVAPTPPLLAGGCAGADGGDGVAANSRGRGGAGGGAFQLSALGAITVAGSLRAGGAGGTGGTVHNAGGGGGGSGGMIGLEGASVTFVASAIVAANGGGGGEGGEDNDNNGQTLPGANGTAGALGTAPAAGGTGTGQSGDGGGGSGNAILTGSAGQPDDTFAGGGGGGAAGFVVVKSGAAFAPNGAVSPPATVL